MKGGICCKQFFPIVGEMLRRQGASSEVGWLGSAPSYLAMTFISSHKEGMTMRTSRRKVEEVLWIVGLHNVARKVYQRSMGRGIRQHFENMHGFYGRLITPGALVFDVGANVGKFSEVLVSLGARVVAIEPNPDLVRHI